MRQMKLNVAIRRVVCGAVAVLFLGFMPAPYAIAEGTDSSDPSGTASCSPVAAAPSGIKQPTGSDATTYTYNSCTGLWENPYYTWSPATQSATPKTPFMYTCDTTTWQWMTSIWTYNPAGHTFFQRTVYSPTLPAGATVAASSVFPCDPATITNPGPGSTNTSDTTGGSNATISNATSGTISNQLNANALSGNASVVGNTQGGSALSGNAAVIANVLNAIQTSSPLTGSGITTFVANINGDVQGDLVIDPSQLQPATDSSALNSANLDVHNATNGKISNDINLAASSGDATVADNTSAGNATSGNAEAVANVMNMLNSVISAGKSFVGVVNVNGNMNGNILMPQSFLDSLIASNAPSTTVPLTSQEAGSLGMSNTNNLSTTNNVTSSATTGDAAVSNNTSAGNATTGNAATSVRIFNLTGSQIIGTNCLLVFVNVSGTWVGVIMNAPTGATAAALGSGITENTTNADITNATNDSIANNIDVSAASGDATVADNTSAGNAHSGNANTAVNLLNMNSSQFNLAGWFGILFINIFGNWYGNFGVYTPPAPKANTSSAPSTTQPPAAPKVFRFVPTEVASSVSGGTTANTVLATVSAHLPSHKGLVLADNTAIAKAAADGKRANVTAQLIGGILIIGGLSALAVEKITSNRRSRSAQA